MVGLGSQRNTEWQEWQDSGTEDATAEAEIPSFPASMPKLLSQPVYSALPALDVSAPCEPVGMRWVFRETGRGWEERMKGKVIERAVGGGGEVAVVWSAK